MPKYLSNTFSTAVQSLTQHEDAKFPRTRSSSSKKLRASSVKRINRILAPAVLSALELAGTEMASELRVASALLGTQRQTYVCIDDGVELVCWDGPEDDMLLLSPKIIVADSEAWPLDEDVMADDMPSLSLKITPADTLRRA